MIKKTLVLLCCLLLIFSIAGCNGDKTPDITPTTPDETVTTPTIDDNVSLDEPPTVDEGDVPEETTHIHDYKEETFNATCSKGGYTIFTCDCGDTFVSNETDKLSHKYKEEIVKATCTSKGYTLYTCEMCKDSYKDDYVDMIVHNYKDTVVKATCEKEGYTKHVCSYCGDEYISDKTTKISHSYSQRVVSPTCTTKGYTEYICKHCSSSYKDNYVEKTQHDYNEKVVMPTCTERGYTVHECKCGDSYIDTYTECLPHKYESTVIAPTCTTEGYTSYICKCGDSYISDKTSKIEHVYSKTIVAPTCTERGYNTYVCNCGDTYIDDYTDVVPHTFGDWKITTNATCLTDGLKTRVCDCGETEIETILKLGHDLVHHEGKSASCEENGWEAYDTCSRCEFTNYKEIAFIGHAFGEWYVADEATCTETGTKARMCLNCYKLEEKEIPIVAHKYEKTITAPTCTSEGYTTYTCYCGYAYTADETDMLEHVFVDYVSNNDATCTENGTKTAQCNRNCGETHTITDDGSMLGHNYNGVITAPTCKERGFTTFTCSACADTYVDDYVETIGHAIYAEVTEPTCTEDGYITIICYDCGVIGTEDATPALGHQFTNYISDNNATCTKDGTKTATCDHGCGTKDTLTDSESALGHNYKDTVIEPTCKDNGYTLHTCDVCGDIYRDNETDKIDHAWGEWTIVKPATVKEKGQEERACLNCDAVETKEIPVIQLDESIVAYYVVSDGKVVDLVNGAELTGAIVYGNYFHSGTVKLPQSYSNWTYQMIVDYNEGSKLGIVKMMKFSSNSGKYEECDNVFKLNELNAIYSRGSVRIPWVKDSWNSGYTVTIPIQLYAHMSTNYEFLPIGDTFWSFSMDSENGVLNSRINGATATTTMSTYTTTDSETKYVSKILPASFTFTDAHLIKELIIYNKAQTVEEQESAYKQTGIVAPQSGINEVVDGLTDMGSSFYVIKYLDGSVKSLASETLSGTYTVTGESGITTSYTISDYVHPDLGIDNSKYESVHITNEPETLELGKQYSLVAYPYPFNIIAEDGKSDQFDVAWSSSDDDIISVIDGLLITKKTGTVTITATLTGTDLSDAVTIKVVKPQEVVDKPWNVPVDYTSDNGDSFSETDYAMTTRAIYAAIDEAYANGYNHVIFPKINFYAQPITNTDGTAYWYYVPSNMTIEFPKGSVFYMMDNEVSRGDGTKIEIHYFHFGVPNNDHQNVCENSHLIVDTYYGERYENTTHKEAEYLEENRFVNFGRKSINCSVEVRNAYYPAGYFIVADGTSNTNKTTGVMNCNDFASGWLNDSGELEENSNWISTINFITVPNYGTDGYFISAHGQDSYAGKYWNGCRARTYDILWFDESYEIILIERFQGRGEYYDIPDNAVYFKVSLQQNILPTSESDEDAPYIAMHSDGSSKFCEIKNTKVWNSACGVFSVVGQTDGLWVHHCYTNRDGMKPYNERTGDFENGWTQMRHSIVSNNSFRGYFANHGYNTFIHTNYMPNYSGFSGEAEMLRYINNTTDFIEISEKCQAHIFYNTLYSIGIDRFSTSIGHIHHANNKTGQWVRSY